MLYASFHSIVSRETGCKSRTSKPCEAKFAILTSIAISYLAQDQSRCQSPRSSVGGIVGLWENAEENQPLIGCLIISLTHSLLIEMRAILIIQEAKYKLVYLTRLFIAELIYSRVNNTPTQYRTMHSQAQYKLHNRKIYAQKNYTMQITCKHSTICS